MIQSPRGYLMDREDEDVLTPDRPVDPHVFRSNVANDVAFLLDARGDVKACWAAVAGTELTASGADLDSKQGADVFSHVETIGPFPLNVLATGQPEPVYVAVDLATSTGGQPVFLKAVLRHRLQGAVLPSLSNPAIRDGWNIGYAETDDSTPEAIRLRCVDDDLEADDPLLGFLQFPRSQWLAREDLPGLMVPDSEEQAQPVSTCLACVDLYLGRLSGSATAELHGYVVRGCSYGARDE